MIEIINIYSHVKFACNIIFPLFVINSDDCIWQLQRPVNS